MSKIISDKKLKEKLKEVEERLSQYANCLHGGMFAAHESDELIEMRAEVDKLNGWIFAYIYIDSQDDFDDEIKQVEENADRFVKDRKASLERKKQRNNTDEKTNN